MINKICYTYWTNNGTNFLSGFPNKELFIACFAKSVEQSKKFFPIIEIYTDAKGAEYLEGKIEANFIIVDYSAYNFDERFWNFPKLVTYNMQEEPFLHIDIDVILKEKPNGLDSSILTEKKRGTLIFQRDVYPLLPVYVKKHLEIICSGLLGGNDYMIFKELFFIACNSVLNKKFDKIKFNNLVAIEEITLTHLVKKDNILSEVINQDKFVHFQGARKNRLTIENIEEIQ